MSEPEDSALSRVSISTGVIPFPSMDSSLVLPHSLSTLQESSSPSPGKFTFKTCLNVQVQKVGGDEVPAHSYFF